VQAGFPSPAENYIRERLNLHDLCVQHPDASYFVEVAGESMNGDRIYPGSILVVDATLDAVSGKIIVGWLNGECTVKRIIKTGEMITLLPSNPDFLPIYVHHPADTFELMGVVTHVVSKPPRWTGDQIKAAQERVRINRSKLKQAH
jgi:DNA polymerase V